MTWPLITRLAIGKPGQSGVGAGVFDWLTHEVSQSAITDPVLSLAAATDVGRGTAAPPGAILIGIARFIPGGRTATTFAAGTLEAPLPPVPRRRRGGGFALEATAS